MIKQTKIIKPINVSWMITDRCNYNCKFCFRFADRREITFSQAKKIIDKLADSGVKKISWAGGEPLLWPHMIDLIEYTHNKGLVTMLITNGSLLTKNLLERLNNCLEWLNLPLDGSTSDVQDLMTRESGHFERVMNILKKTKNLKMKLKINTVVTKLNVYDIVNISSIIKKYKIKRWKLFQFYSVRWASIINKNRFEISKKDFSEVREKTLNEFENNECMVVFENNDEFENSYFSIAPDGEVYTSKDGGDIFMGNLLTESMDKIWNNSTWDKEKYWQRANWSFNNGDNVKK